MERTEQEEPFWSWESDGNSQMRVPFHPVDRIYSIFPESIGEISETLFPRFFFARALKVIPDAAIMFLKVNVTWLVVRT